MDKLATILLPDGWGSLITPATQKHDTFNNADEETITANEGNTGGNPAFSVSCWHMTGYYTKQTCSVSEEAVCCEEDSRKLQETFENSPLKLRTRL